MNGKITFCLLAIALILITGCVSTTPGEIVKCSSYYHVTDLYRTPPPCDTMNADGLATCYYMQLKEKSFPTGITKEFYNTLSIGDTVALRYSLDGYVKVNITYLNESTSGLRGACEVLP